jgi:hypothetical protein
MMSCRTRSIKKLIALCLQVRYVVGECFYHADPDEAEEKIQAGTRSSQSTLRHTSYGAFYPLHWPKMHQLEGFCSL